MNFKKIRKILIIFLVFVNLLLLTNFLNTLYTGYKLNLSKITNSINFLKAKNIYVSDDVLEFNFSNTDAYEINLVNSNALSSILTDVSRDENNIFVGKNGFAKINQDGSFLLNLNGEYTQSSVKQLLENAGFNFTSFSSENIGNSVKYTYILNNLSVSGLEFEVTIDSNTAVISGTYLLEFLHSSQNKNEFDMLNIITDLYLTQNISGEIKSVKKGYNILMNNKTFIVPVLVFSTENKEYIYNLYNDSLT